VTGLLPQSVMYHYVRDAETRPLVGSRSLPIATFERQLEAICREWTPVDWRAVLAALRGGPALPRDAVLLTFDDGLADHHRHVLPRLAARGLSAVFFVLARQPGDGLALGHKIHVLGGALEATAIRDAVVERMAPGDVAGFLALESALRAVDPSDPDDPWKRPLQRELEMAAGPILSGLVEKHIGPEAEIATDLYLDGMQLRELSDAGMTIGGHGRDHPWLDWIDPVRVRQEIGASAAFLHALTPSPWPFAYPYGGVPRAAGTVLSSAGFAAAFTTRGDERGDRFRIGRHDGDELGVAGIPPRTSSR
jgi:peptidoglycan/xylan/chitin deacetylase (PgdA/CDA1 family)